MKIKKLFQSDILFYYMVLETTDGQYKKFFISPFRKLSEEDLTPIPHWHPSGVNGIEADPYMYKFYGLEKE